jgi:hypothetical protein
VGQWGLVATGRNGRERERERALAFVVPCYKELDIRS